ncbi:MAG: M13 family metallopeptidase [Micrococcales bacterium]
MTAKFGIDASTFDPSVRIQDDLFRHVNGTWLKNTEIPEDKAIYGSFHMLADDAEEAVRQILEGAAADPKPGVSQQIGDLYASFLDEARANELGAAPIAADLKLIETIRGIDDATKLLGEWERSGISGLFGMYVDNDPGQPDRYLLNIYHGGLGLPDEAYYREEKHAEIRDAYVPHIAQMFTLAGWSQEAAAAAARTVMEFETQLAKHHWNVVDSRDAEKVYNLHSFEELKALTPTFDWNLWLAGAHIDESVLAEVVVMMPSFLSGLQSVYNDVDIEAVKLWMAWQVIRSAAPFLSDDFVNERFAFYGTKLTGAPMNRARWKRAVTLVEGSMGEAVGEIYVEKHFPPAAKEKMDELVQYLIDAYRQSILGLDWMTEETKQKALVKLSKFTPKIGYPVKWKDYSSIVIHRDDLIGNVRRVNAWSLEREVKKIGSPLDRDEWFMNPQTVNAYYNPGFNEIVFPAAILQHPFFHLQADDAVNFGAIGAVIGHEIGHGFDDQGSKYDGDGALQSWWTEEDRKAFEKRTKNLIDQYSQLSPEQLGDEHKVNGELTIGENIGDLGGLGIAYRAYLMSLGENAPEVIDGFTGEQRFFLSWAQAWRTKGRDEMVLQRLATDPHSPPEFRCNQIVRNIDAFYEAFDVKPGDALWLDPADRVSIW